MLFRYKGFYEKICKCRGRSDYLWDSITHVLPPAACTVGIGDERTVCVFGTAEGTFRPSTDPMEEIESAWYTRAQVRALHETDLFGSWALAYSWMFANGCLPGV